MIFRLHTDKGHDMETVVAFVGMALYLLMAICKYHNPAYRKQRHTE